MCEKFSAADSNMLSPPTTAYLINLDRAKKRRAKATASITRGGFNTIVRVPGVDGRRMKYDDRRRATGSAFSAFTLTGGQLGCALGHLAAWKTFLTQSADDSAVFFEDDANVKEGTAAKLVELWPEVAASADVLLLGCAFACGRRRSVAEILFAGPSYLGGSRPFSRKAPTVGKHLVVARNVRGLHAYVLTRAAAAKLVAHLDGRVRGHVDVAMDSVPRLRVLALDDQLADQGLGAGRLGDSSIATAKPPELLNSLLDHVPVNEQISVGYGMVVPVIQIGNYHVNAWSFVFAAMGLLLWFKLGRLPVAAAQRAWGIAAAVLVLLFAYDAAKDPLDAGVWSAIVVSLLLALGPSIPTAWFRPKMDIARFSFSPLVH
jgi:GR25 family glycosyltransferase involved in LPS biosynthesis